MTSQVTFLWLFYKVCRGFKKLVHHKLFVLVSWWFSEPLLVHLIKTWWSKFLKRFYWKLRISVKNYVKFSLTPYNEHSAFRISMSTMPRCPSLTWSWLLLFVKWKFHQNLILKFLKKPFEIYGKVGRLIWVKREMIFEPSFPKE